MVSSSTAAGIGFVEVASITMDGIYHVAYAICNDGWVLGSYVVQELFQSCHGGYHGFRLLQCKCAERGEDGAVDISSCLLYTSDAADD